MTGICPIVAYRPKPGKEAELLQLVRARDGTIIEVSEWKSREAIEAAHQNPNVLAMWSKFFELCECVPRGTLAEAEEIFAGFEPVDE